MCVVSRGKHIEPFGQTPSFVTCTLYKACLTEIGASIYASGVRFWKARERNNNIKWTGKLKLVFDDQKMFQKL